MFSGEQPPIDTFPEGLERDGISRQSWDSLSDDQRRALRKWIQILNETLDLSQEKREEIYADEYEQMRIAHDALFAFQQEIEKKDKIAERTRYYEQLSEDTLISDIGPIMEMDAGVGRREDLAMLVEPPLLEACQILFDKNIHSVMSSANKKDLEYKESCAYILIEYEGLSPDNKQIADRICQRTVDGGYRIEVPLNPNSTFGEVKKAAFELVSTFKQQ